MELFLTRLTSHIRREERIDLRMWVRTVFATLFMLAINGCSTLSVTLTSPPEPIPANKFFAGASRDDITPPPGYPMGGHSMAGKIGRGFWLRLNARSIFIEDPNGIRMALVSTDLWAMPAGLADRVAELISKGLQDCVVGRSGLIIAATHTHQSPANFSTSAAYNTFASPIQGFDPDLFEFLAQRIATSIGHACQNKQEAEAFFNEVRITRDVPLARNRSFEAFNSDPESNNILKRNKDLPVGEITPEYPFPDSYRAVDPAIRVLRIKKKESPHDDIAIAAFVAVHNTSMTHEAKVYSSDIFGAAALSIEKKLSLNAGLPKPVVAIFNGAEGDISPAWRTQDRRDTLRLGEELAGSILDAPIGQRLEESLNYRFELVPIANKCFPCQIGQWGDSFDCPKNKLLCTAAAPLSGVGTLGGAEDGRTFFYYLGCREGIKDHSKDATQGNKRPMLNCIGPAVTTVQNAVSGGESSDDSQSTSIAATALSQLLADASKVPDTIPLGIYSIGHLRIATLPGEFTMVMGKRIADEIKQRLPATLENAENNQHAWKRETDNKVVLIGLANEYLSYFTTPEEYQMQAYEGASTLYGVGAGEFVKYYLGMLAQKLQEGPPTPENEVVRKYYTGPAKRFGIDTIENNVNISGAGFTSVLLDTESGLRDFKRIPAFCWPDRKITLSSTNDINFQATPRISIWTKNSTTKEIVPLMIDGIPEDDTGLDFVSMIVSHNADEVKWCSFWLVPDRLKQRVFDFHFLVHSIGKSAISPDCFWETSGEVNTECRFKTAE